MTEPRGAPRRHDDPRALPRRPPARRRPVSGALRLPRLWGVSRLHLTHLARLDPAHAWLRVSVQGLHRFYTRANQVVASWMTREDRARSDCRQPRLRRGRARSGRRATTRRATSRSSSASRRGRHRPTARPLPPVRRVTASSPSAATCRPTWRPRRPTLPPVLIGRGVRDEWYTRRQARRRRGDAAGRRRRRHGLRVRRRPRVGRRRSSRRRRRG